MTVVLDWEGASLLGWRDSCPRLGGASLPGAESLVLDHGHMIINMYHFGTDSSARATRRL